MHGGDWPPKLSVRASISVIPVLHTWTSAIWLVMLNLLLKFLVPDDPVLFEAPLWVFSVLVFSSSECKQQSLSEKTQSAFPELLIFSHTVLVKFHKADISWHWVLQECLAPDPCPPNYCSGTYWVRKPSCRQVRQRVYDLQHQKKKPSSDLQVSPVLSLQNQCKKNTPLLSPLQSYMTGPSVKPKRPIAETIFKPAGYSRAPSGWMISARKVDKVSAKPVQTAALCLFPLLLQFQLIQLDLIFCNCTVRFYLNLPPVFYQLVHPCIMDSSTSDLTGLPPSLLQLQKCSRWLPETEHFSLQF